ncbi:MAG: winged helix-turn-helix transcriptional regulator, partial [candidate division NC10 bacterium]|nr:winged helix-turn-helix transcriptional regulator [candidate division NC10 bacterium]
DGAPPQTEYLLTQRGRSLRRALVPVLQWAAEPVT